MTWRNVKSRLVKLEARQHRVDQFLAVWCTPGGDSSKALSDAKFAAGDLIVCFPWSGDGPPPAPRWHRNQRPSFDLEEERSINQALKVASGVLPKSAQISTFSHMPDGELYHRIWGVNRVSNPNI